MANLPKSSSFERSLALPFAHLNLRFNPFGELPRDVRGFLAVVDIEQFLGPLRQPRFAVQFIGDQGRGKTTHLLAIQHNLPRAAYVYIDEFEKHPPIPSGNPLLIDEAQRLSWLERRVAFRKGVGLAIATHDDLSGPLQKFGYQVTTVSVDGLIHPRQLLECFNKRIAYARRASGPLPSVTLQTATKLHRMFGTDIRAMEGHLYDLFQELEDIRDV